MRLQERTELLLQQRHVSNHGKQRQGAAGQQHIIILAVTHAESHLKLRISSQRTTVTVQVYMHFKLTLVLSQLLLHMLSGLLADQVQYCMCT